MHQLLFTLCLRGWWLTLSLYLLVSLATSQAQTATWTGWTGQVAAPTTEFTSITYGNGLYVAVANKGENSFYVYTSPDGRNWTSGPYQLGASSLAAFEGWQAITYGGGRFLAVNRRYPGVMWSSNVGATAWLGVASMADDTTNWRAVTYGGGQYVGISAKGIVFTSPDALTYARHNTSNPNGWSSIAFGNGLYVAVASSGSTDQVITSPDGITWTARTAAASNGWNSVTYGNGVFVAVASSGTGNRVMTSPDGITWTARAAAADNDWSEVTFGGGQFVAVATSGVGNRVMTSPDGISWTARAAASDNEWVSVTYGGGQYVAVAAYGDYNRFMTSPDGITWTGYQGNYSSVWSGITYGKNQFVAVDPVYEQSMTSPDGVSWTSHKAPQVGKKVAYGNGLFVSVGKHYSTDNGVVTSPDGVSWTQRSSPMTDLLGIIYGNGQFVAVGENGVMTSPDGLNWTVRDEEKGLTSVVYGEGLYVAIASNGVVITSPDALTWTQRKGRTQESAQRWLSITYGAGKFVAVAYFSPRYFGEPPAKIVMTSLDGITWTIYDAPTSATQWTSVVYGNGLFVAVGERDGDSDAWSMTSTNGIDWTPRIPPLNAWSAVTYARGLFVAVAAFSYLSPRSMVMTAGCLQPLVRVTANPSLTITQGQSTTLTASGAATYKWSSGQTTPSHSVSTTGVYSVTGTRTEGCISSAIVSVSVTVNPAPDLSPLLTTLPSTQYGTTNFTTVVDVFELNSGPAAGPVMVYITKDPRIHLSFNETSTLVGGKVVQNGKWTFDGTSNENAYILTSQQGLGAKGKSSVGLTGVLTPGNTQGSLTLTTTIAGASEGELKVTNNTAANKIDYFKK
jgi:hypothetical protein